MRCLDLELIIFLLSTGFVAAFFDSVVGGGGLISTPALMMTGLPINIVLGTNKMASIMCSSTSTLTFFRSGKINLAAIKYPFILAILGSMLGASSIKLIPVAYLKNIIIVMLALVAIYTFFRKDWGEISTYGATRKNSVIALLFALVLGFYDGFFGPGTGSFLIFAFLLIGFDFVTAAGNAKALNFASNLGALVTFIYMDSVNYAYGLVMGVAMIAGALVGARFAINKGVTYVRPLFLMVTMAMIGKQLWDIAVK